jgi:ABC-type sugar transport system ATPase subunit
MPAKLKVSLHNVARSFVSPAGERIQAIRDINLEVEDLLSPDGRDIGELRVLLGPSGCGKSTILRLIAGLDHPDSGQILVNGAPVTGPGRDRGMVFQKYTSFPWLTVSQNIEYGLKINGFPEQEKRWDWPALSRRTPIRFPAACSSVWPSRARWPCGPPWS